MRRRRSAGPIVRTREMAVLHRSDGTTVEIEYVLARSGRRTTTLTVSQEGILAIHTTRTASAAYIDGLLRQHTDWILRQMTRQQARRQAAQEHVPRLSMEERQATLRLATARMRTLLAERIACYEPMLPENHIRITRIRIAMQKTRWGSCSARGTLSFNVRLYLAPPEILDYVVVHELCHLCEMNHSARFWAMVGSILPDYEARRAWLREHGDTLQF